MPERLDRITVSLNGGDLTLSWHTRQELLARLQHINTKSGIRAAFGAVGASRPVELSPNQKVTLQRALVDWADDGMPSELVELTDALTAELADDE
jgi:hypothetical protein